MDRVRLRGFVRRPTLEQIRALAAMEYMHPTDEELKDLEAFVAAGLAAMDRLDDLPIPELPVKYKERDRGYRPTPQEDPYNVFIRKCLVKGAPSGKLAGKRVGLKDNLRVAGVPTTNASRLMGDYIPTNDATVVERLLDAGAVIVGKLNMDEFSLSGTGESSVFGYPRNPRNPAYSAGGSSGGSGAAVAASEVDIALGVDQGGSGRIPASWCGVVSLKPTHGLVPTFGVTYMDHTLDFICPMARTVSEVALTLEAIAGEDPKDAQWVRGPIRVDQYTKALRKDVSGVRIGVIKETFESDPADADVTRGVKEAIGKLESLGATVHEMSLPLWKEGISIWYGIAAHSVSAMVASDQEGYWRGGFCDVHWQEAFGKARRVNSDVLNPVLKVLIILGKYLSREYYSTYFSKATNLRFLLKQELDKILEKVDVLAMPTTPIKAVKLSTVPLSASELAGRAGSAATNTIIGNISGLPALSVPCGVGEHGLPIGLMLYGRRWEESTLFRVGYTFEQSRPDVAPARRARRTGVSARGARR